MIPASDRWGPFRTNLDEAKPWACLGALRLLAGPRAVDLCRLLALAETDPAALARPAA